jgi:hypothetical protein
MGGYSGSAPAVHTRLVCLGHLRLACTPAQVRLVERAIAGGGAVHVTGREVISARYLERLQLGSVRDDGGVRPDGSSNQDGERWVFTLAKGVTVT